MANEMVQWTISSDERREFGRAAGSEAGGCWASRRDVRRSSSIDNLRRIAPYVAPDTCYKRPPCPCFNGLSA